MSIQKSITVRSKLAEFTTFTFFTTLSVWQVNSPNPISKPLAHKEHWQNGRNKRKRIRYSNTACILRATLLPTI